MVSIQKFINEDLQEKIEEQNANMDSGIESLENTGDIALDVLNAIVGLRETVASLNYGDFHSSLLGLIGDLKKSMNDYTSKDSDGRTFFERTRDSLTDKSLGLTNSEMYKSPYFTQWLAENSGGQTGGSYSNQALRYAKEMTMRDKLADAGWSQEDIDAAMNKWLNQGSELASVIATYYDNVFKGIKSEQEDLVKELTELYKTGSFDSISYYNTTRKAYELQIKSIQALLETAKLRGDTDAVTEYERQLAELGYQMSSAFQQFAESLYGIGFEDLLDNWISIFEEFGDNVEGAFAKMDESIDQMFVNMLKKRLIIEPMMEYFDNLIKQYTNDEGDITDEMFESLLGDLKDGKGEFLNRWNAFVEKLRQEGLSLNGMNDTSTLTGSIQNLSEETGGIIAGRLNAMVINQAESTSVLRQSLLVQHEMNDHLATIENDLATIKRNMPSTNDFNPNTNYGYSS